MNGKGRKSRARTRIESQRDSAATNKNEKVDFSKLLTSGPVCKSQTLRIWARIAPILRYFYFREGFFIFGEKVRNIGDFLNAELCSFPILNGRKKIYKISSLFE